MVPPVALKVLNKKTEEKSMRATTKAMVLFFIFGAGLGARAVIYSHSHLNLNKVSELHYLKKTRDEKGYQDGPVNFGFSKIFMSAKPPSDRLSPVGEIEPPRFRKPGPTQSKTLFRPPC